MAPAPIRVAALAKQLGREVEGDADVAIDGLAALEGAGPGDLSFVRSERYAEALAASKAAALIAPPGVDAGGRPVIRSPNPGLDFARAARLVVPAARPAAGVHAAAHVEPDAHVDASASIGPGCAVGAHASIGPRTVLHANVTLYENVTLGADCVVHAGCVLREGTVVGDRVILQPGVVLGGDGFGYAVNEDGAFEGMPQLGRVVVGDDVEIGANTTVDRGTLGDTTLARGVKIDNLVMISHNCALGENAMIIAQAGLAGSTRVGRSALILSQAGVVDHVRIGDGAYVGPQSGVTSDVPDGARVLGSPHQELSRTRRVWMLMRRLPELAARLRAVERRLGVGRSDGDEAG